MTSAFDLRHARYVGRVGALAVALGVGSSIAGLPFAAADPAGPADSSQSTSPQPG